MSTVRLAPENTDHPKVRALRAHIKATKQIDGVPNICSALATNPVSPGGPTEERPAFTTRRVARAPRPLAESHFMSATREADRG